MNKQNLRKYTYLALGCFSILLGIIGIFVPLMPTTCFLIASAWCFAWADRCYIQRLFNHPRIGPMVKKIHPRFMPNVGLEAKIQS